ncbi:hypothetical protein AMTR_s00074p00128620 [Amborella trichopoda]|uniref:Uncharacterized protein n=1 Tax=Amborella trichopoda TaxID=13333 RepID=W1NMZ0_AMBTC|nr:hypothetical protein AMTR_s00074p00128620 [Amborella trichopoda]
MRQRVIGGGRLYWRFNHPWKAINNAKHDNKAGKRFAPLSFSKVFELDYPVNGRELAEAHSLHKDDENKNGGKFNIVNKLSGSTIAC